MSRDGTWKQVRTEWRDAVLVCRKCARKLDGGFGVEGRDGFAKALRRSLDAGAPRKLKARRRAVAVVEVDCLDICPKKAVVVVKASEPGAMILVPKGAGMPDVMARLGFGAGDPHPPRPEPRDAPAPDVVGS